MESGDDLPTGRTLAILYARLVEQYHHWYLREASDNPCSLLLDFIRPSGLGGASWPEDQSVSLHQQASSLDHTLVHTDREAISLLAVIHALRSSQLGIVIQENRLSHMEHGFSGAGQFQACVDAATLAERMDVTKGSVIPTFYLGEHSTVVLKP